MEIGAQNGIIHIDRSIRPVYPGWSRGPMHPELEMTGPDEFDVGELEQWLLPKQETDVVTGDVIYQHLTQTDALKTCVGLQDLLGIQKEGIGLFRKHFAGKAAFAWRSIAVSHDMADQKSVVLVQEASLHVPFLYEVYGGVRLNWLWLINCFHSVNPALRYQR